jgi:germination protein YpeB
MSDSVREMIADMVQNQKLSSSQKASIDYMYQTNSALKQSLNGLTSTATAADMLQAVAGKGNALGTAFDDIENNVIETPKEIYDGPFAENVEKVNAKALESLKEITAPEAEKLAQKYFKAYKVTDVTCTGEATAKALVCYNVTLNTEQGEMFAQLSKQGGKVVMFDSYKDCTDKKFSVERCEEIAQDFLVDLGYTDMQAVWTSENGTTCNLNFAYKQDGVICYTDLIKVKVCEERGIVTGLEAFSYVLNHTARTLPKAQVTKAQAQDAINADLDVKGSRLCLIPLHGEELLAYEFYGSLSGSDYYVYVDAATGKEVKVFTVIGTAQGTALL